MATKTESGAGSATRAPDGRLSAAGRLALIVVCGAVFLTALDQYVVVTSIRRMSIDVNVPITDLDRLAWIISGYLLGYVIAMPLMGRIADIYGRWRIFALCLVLFGLGSLLCALSPALGSPVGPDTTTLGGAVLSPFYTVFQWFLGPLGALGVDTSSPSLDFIIGARFLQAVGGGALVPVALAVVGDLFGGRRRGLALGLIGAVAEGGGVLGPLWGAFITSTWGWQWIFFLNLPIVAALLILGFLSVPRARGAREPIDYIGALIFGASLIFLTVGLGQQSGTPGAFNLSAHAQLDPRFLGTAALLFLVFVVVEMRLRWPIVRPALFRRGAFSGSAILSLIIGIALVVALVEIPVFMYSVSQSTDIAAGLSLLRMTALIPVGALAGGWLTGRFGCPPAAVLGTLMVAGGLWLMHLWPVNVGDAQITVATVIAGLGFGLVIAPINTSALNGSPASQAGVASSVVTVLRMSGMILGLAALTSFGLARFRAVFSQLPPSTSPNIPLVSHQVLTDIFGIAAGIALLGVLPALLLWRQRRAGVGAAADEGVTADAEYRSYVAPLA